MRASGRWSSSVGDDKEAYEAATRQRRMRSIAIALALGGLVMLFYVATIVRLGSNVMNRPM